MRTVKDKKKFGWNKIPKNHSCKKFGYCEGKLYRKYKRRLARAIKHKLLMGIPLTQFDITRGRYLGIIV